MDQQVILQSDECQLETKKFCRVDPKPRDLLKTRRQAEPVSVEKDWDEFSIGVKG